MTLLHELLRWIAAAADVLLLKRKPPELANEVCQCAVHKRCHDKILGKCPGSGKESQNTIVSPRSLSFSFSLRYRLICEFFLTKSIFREPLLSVFLLHSTALDAFETFSRLRASNTCVV